MATTLTLQAEDDLDADGPGSANTGVGGSGTTDLGNGWTLLAHAAAGSSNTSDVTTYGIDTSRATLVVLSVGCATDAAADTPTDSKGNTWTGTTRYSGGGGFANVTFFYCVSPTVGSGHTFSTTGGSAGGDSFPAIAVIA